jgi:hypothetical protein
MDTTWTGKEELDLDYLGKLKKAIEQLLILEDKEEEDSKRLHDARCNLKRRIKGVAVDFNLNREFIDSYSKIAKVSHI